MTLRLVTDAATELVSLAEVKLHMRLSTSDTAEDTLLNTLIKVSRTQAENLTKRAFAQETWKLTIDGFPPTITLPRPPVSASASDVVITYQDSVSGNSTTLGATAYKVEHQVEPAVIHPSTNSSNSNSWPNVFSANQSVTVQYVCGTTVAPDDVKAWCLIRIADMYENRESVIAMGGISQLINMPRTFIDGLLDRHCIIEVSP